MTLSSKRQANRPYPAVTVGMELGRSDLHPSTDSEVQPLADPKHPKNDARREKRFLLAGIWPIEKESRVLFEHWPNFPPDTVFERRIPKKRAPQSFRATRWETPAERVLDTE